MKPEQTIESLRTELEAAQARIVELEQRIGLIQVGFSDCKDSLRLLRGVPRWPTNPWMRTAGLWVWSAEG